MVTKALNEWLEKYGFETRVRGLNTDGFFYYWCSDVIEYTFHLPQQAIDSWDLLMDELELPYNIGQFFTSFLHELGHAETLCEFSEEELESDENESHRLAMLLPSIENDMAYYHLPTEMAATRWAIDYIIAYPERVKELVEKISPLVLDNA
jgi:hypothetical protein